MTEQEIFKMKKIWRGHEIPIYDYLMSFREALTTEFMGNHTSVEDAAKSFGVANLDLRGLGLTLEESAKGIVSRDKDTGEFKTNVEGWMGIHFKYERHDEMIDVALERKETERIAKRYPTAFKLMKEYGPYCVGANYSILAPQTILHRHTGPENRDGKYLRIHVPLIIPEGDLFLEASGEEVNWDDLWGFNNQHAHSAYNYSDEWRIIFMIDLDMEHIGMEYQPVYNPAIDLCQKPFIRGKFTGQI